MLFRTIGSSCIAFATVRSAQAADLTIVDVPQGMILQTQLARTLSASPRAGAPVEFVVTHDLRIGSYVVIPAGSRGAGHVARSVRDSSAATAPRIACDYVIASDGTRIPVAGSLPYLTTRASRAVVIYAAGENVARTPGLPVTARIDASLARP